MEVGEPLHATFTYTNTYFLQIPHQRLNAFELGCYVPVLLHFLIFKIDTEVRLGSDTLSRHHVTFSVRFAKKIRYIILNFLGVGVNLRVS